MQLNNLDVKSLTEITKLVDEKNYKKAEFELIKIISNEKENHQNHFLLGNVYVLLNEHLKAKEQFQISIKLNPNNKVAHYNLGLMCNELGNYELSQKSFEYALNLDPEYLYANLAMAMCFEKQNIIAKAKIFYEKTLKIKNDFPLANQMYANFLIKNGEINKGQHYTYKYAGIIRLSDKSAKNIKLNRTTVSENTNFIGCWNINNEEICEKIINFFERRKDLQKNGEVGYGNKNQAVKKSIDISIHPRNLNQDGYEDLKNYFDYLNECFQDYKRQWPFIKQNIQSLDIPSFNIQKYEIGGHFGMMHCERVNLQSMHRVFAWMTYLNDVEDGGETYFDHFDLRVKPKAGKTLIWPAEWTHAHRGEILKKGLKYIVTGWMHFPFNVKL